MLKIPVRVFQIALFLLVWFAGQTQAVAADRLTGTCVGVTDGDTVKILVDKNQLSVRLEGIDCPESGQDFSRTAKKHTSALMFGKTVEIELIGSDRMGRIIAVVYAGDINVNLSLVEAGLAWHFKRYSSDPRLASAEQSARTAKKGLWSLPTPIPPWDWRDGKKEPQPPPSKSGTPSQDGDVVYHGNSGSQVFHHPRCRYYWCKNCVVELTSREAALKLGFKPCGVCNP